MKLPPETPLSEAPWIPSNRLTPLGKLGLLSLRDLVFHFPRRHEDRSRFDVLPEGDSDEPICLCGEVLSASRKFFGRRGGWFEIELGNEQTDVFSRRWTCRWFHSPYLHKIFAVGDRVVVFGRTKAKKGGQVVMDHPEFEILEEEGGESVHFGRITPVHPAGEGVTVRNIRTWIFRALEETDLDSLACILPGGDDGMSRTKALRALHFPESQEELRQARPRLALEEFFGVQAVLVSRRESVRRRRGSGKRSGGNLLRRMIESLPFEFTDGQQKALEQILEDLASEEPMQRLLQGDVGAGKTIVALAAALQTIESGFQTVFMAPTQILAAQHAGTFRALLDPLGVPVELFTASRKEAADGGLPLFGGGEFPSLVVGTHALLYDSVPLANPGLVIIDEQHKFGVMQRARLMDRGVAPDLLVMTATPIPRTLTQTLHGDLDVSVIREKPANRGRVITVVRPEKKLPEIAKFLRDQLADGRQIFIVYPLVGESEALSAKAATKEFEKWSAELSPHRVGLLHGKLRPEEKDAVMEEFRRGTCGVLVSTTVVEVGVDIPNATVMLVENAERFGLAQLHQLRGRIGRGSQKSYCILVTGNKADEALQRLQVLERTNDGFEIAEEDLRLRGPGDLVGTAQTGLPPMRVGDILRDAELMTQARQMARKVFETDPALELPEHTELKRFLELQQSQMLAAGG